MAKKKPTATQNEDDGLVVDNDIFVDGSEDTSEDSGVGAYKIGDLSNIDMGERDEFAETEEDPYASYEDIDDPDSKYAKKLQKASSTDETAEDEDPKVDEFLDLANFDREEEEAKYYD